MLLYKPPHSPLLKYEILTAETIYKIEPSDNTFVRATFNIFYKICSQ